MRKFIVIMALMAVALACAPAQDLPPSPSPPGGAVGVGQAVAGLAGAMPSWAASPKNVVLTPQTAYYNDAIIVNVDNFDYIYQNGYFFNSKARTWQRFALQGEKAQEWVKASAIGSVQVSPDVFAEGENFVVVYACSKVGGRWDCNDDRWMLAKFVVEGSATGEVPDEANVEEFIVSKLIPPFELLSTGAEVDNFGEINVIRYDARYREQQGLVVLVHVFDFNARSELDETLRTFFTDIVNKGWKEHKGHNVALYLGQNDHYITVWSSGKQLVWVETFSSESANKEIIEGYLRKYPSDLTKVQ